MDDIEERERIYNHNRRDIVPVTGFCELLLGNILLLIKLNDCLILCFLIIHVILCFYLGALNDFTLKILIAAAIISIII